MFVENVMEQFVTKDLRKQLSKNGIFLAPKRPKNYNL